MEWFARQLKAMVDRGTAPLAEEIILSLEETAGESKGGSSFENCLERIEAKVRRRTGA